MFLFPFQFFNIFKRTPDYEQPFAAKYGLRTNAQQQKEFDEHIRSVGPLSPVPVSDRLLADQHAMRNQFYKELQKKRPGDTEPKQYLNTTNANLVKTINTYENEIVALDKDIGKLTEERRQALIAVEGLRAAVAHINGEGKAVKDCPQLTEEEIERIAANSFSEALTSNKIND